MYLKPCKEIDISLVEKIYFQMSITAWTKKHAKNHEDSDDNHYIIEEQHNHQTEEYFLNNIWSLQVRTLPDL